MAETRRHHAVYPHTTEGQAENKYDEHNGENDVRHADWRADGVAPRRPVPIGDFRCGGYPVVLAAPEADENDEEDEDEAGQDADEDGVERHQDAVVEAELLPLATEGQGPELQGASHVDDVVVAGPGHDGHA